MLKNVIKQYIRNNKNNKIGMLIAGVDDNNRIIIGWSLCNKRDKFNRDKAFDIAVGRGNNNDKYFDCINESDFCYDKLSLVPPSIENPLSYFLTRMSRYYKFFNTNKSDFLYNMTEVIGY